MNNLPTSTPACPPTRAILRLVLVVLAVAAGLWLLFAPTDASALEPPRTAVTR